MDNDQEEEPPIPSPPVEETQAEKGARDARDEEQLEQLGPLKQYSGRVRSPYLIEFTLLMDDNLRHLPTPNKAGEEDIGFHMLESNSGQLRRTTRMYELSPAGGGVFWMKPDVLWGV